MVLCCSVAMCMQMLDLIERPLSAHGYKFVRYDGSMNIKERDEVLSKFRTSKSTTVLLMSLKCGSLGKPSRPQWLSDSYAVFLVCMTLCSHCCLLSADAAGLNLA